MSAKIRLCIASLGVALVGAAAASDDNFVPAPPPAVPYTQQFEAGELKMERVSSPQLEDLLRDLNHRRDYDFSQHDRQPGPDHAYLTTWIGRVVKELTHRGYYYDPQGDLHRPGTIVSTPR